MFRFTISAGNFLIKVLYVLSIIGIVVGGIAAMANCWIPCRFGDIDWGLFATYRIFLVVVKHC